MYGAGCVGDDRGRAGWECDLMIPIGLIALGIVVVVLVFAFALCNIAADDKGDDDYD